MNYMSLSFTDRGASASAVTGSSADLPDIGAIEYTCCMLMLRKAVATLSDQIRSDSVG